MKSERVPSIEKNSAVCTGCGACNEICRQKAVSMQMNIEGFLYPKIDSNLCVHCGRCLSVCPVGMESDIRVPVKLYAAWNKNIEVRLVSSSGGIFSLIATQIINSGGVVYAPIFSSDYSEVFHSRINCLGALEGAKGSKYLQSNKKDAFFQVKKDLDSGLKVLFSGTPCEIAGLLSFLKKDYDNLLTQDVVCMGVPSPGLWKEYIEYHCNKMSSNIKNVSFRDKLYGWQEYIISFTFLNGKKYRQERFFDPYMLSFRSKMNLRNSCYACDYRQMNRVSDITLGDFWGIESLLPNMYDKNGVSLVLVNSKRGYEIFNLIKEYMVFQEVPMEIHSHLKAMIANPIYRPIERKAFFDLTEKKGFIYATKKYCTNEGGITVFKNKIGKKIQHFREGKIVK